MIISFLIFLQFMMFAFLPAIDPDTLISDKKTVAINFVIKKSGILIIELAIGLLIIFLINKKLLKLSFGKNILVLAIELAIGLFSILMFSLNYINKFD
jgi:hypothetical protein